MQEKIIDYKIRGLGNLLEPIQTADWQTVNIKGFVYAFDPELNGYKYKEFAIIGDNE